MTFISHIQINSKWITDLTVRPKTITIPEENTGSYLCDLEFSKDFLDMIPKAQVIKEQIDKFNFIKIKDTIKKVKIKDKLQTGRKYLQIIFYRIMPFIQNT